MLALLAVERVENVLKRGKKRGLTRFFIALICLVLLSLAGGIIVKFTITDLPTITLIAPSASRIGLDYYHESMGYIKRTDSEVMSDLEQIQTITHRLKVYHNPFDSSSQGNVARIVKMAKAQKMYVIWTENDDSLMLTNANWGEYAGNVISDAALAHVSGSDEFLVGNELSLHNNGDSNFNDNQLPVHVKQLVIACQTNFPGPKGYEEGWFKSGSWKMLLSDHYTKFISLSTNPGTPLPLNSIVFWLISGRGQR